MLRYLPLLLLMCGTILAQDDDEDDGIEMDSTPPPEESPKRPAAQPAREPGKKPGRVKIKAKGYEFELPNDWGLTVDGDSKAELAWQVRLPGSQHDARLRLWREETVGDVRLAPLNWREGIMKDLDAKDSEIRQKPFPQLIVHAQDGGVDSRFAYLLKQIKGNSFCFQLICATDDFRQAHADVSHAVRSFRADVKIFPAIPEGYVISRKGPYLFARHPSVTRSLATMRKVIRAQEKSFRKFHGAWPESDRPIVVLVHNSKMQGARILKAVGDDENDFHVDTNGFRLFAVPISKVDSKPAGYLASECRGLFFLLKYGDWKPLWVWGAEREIGRAEARTGKGLPNLGAGFVQWYSETELGDVSGLVHEPNSRAAFFYVCSFHGGKYRKQYKAFLREYAETHDGMTAFAKHVESIGDLRLRKAAKAYVERRIKPVKPKK